MPEAILQSLVAYVAVAAVLTVTPGLDTAMVLRSSAAQGPRAGAAAGLGICLGLLVWGCAAAFGLTAILLASELAFTAVKWAGAAYLLYLGVKLILTPRAEWNTHKPASGLDRRGGALAALRRGFLTNMLNPKVGVFYVTLFPQFIPHGANVAAVALLLTGAHVVLTLAWFSLLIGLTVPLGRLLARTRIVQALDRLTGCVFVAFGLRLAIARRG
jgi:threonine/homoserine/homoserine lactone efflux protein